MDYLIYLLIVFVGAAIPFVEYMAAIPIGIIVGLPTIPIVIVGFIGNLVTVLLIIILADKVRELIRKRRTHKTPTPAPAEEAYEDGDGARYHIETVDNDTVETPVYENYSSKQSQKAHKLWDKYGLPGLALLGTGLLSSHLTALMACTFGGNRAYISIWMTISLAVWSILTGVAVHLGMDAFFR